MEAIKGFGRMFYLINPNDTYIKNVEDVPDPDYVNQATPYFLTFILLEYFIQLYRGKPVARINDGITSVSLGMMMICGKTVFLGLESYAYIKIYENLRIYELPWDSPWTWYFTALGVDFGYYWVHRYAHEWNFFWAQHQVHHSSEDYNLTTALRQSIFQGWVSWVFYLPLAFFVPPSIFLIHTQFNLVFQFWIHTETVDHLGPLEYILNTPRHHRIHHGSNRYCLDKNYAGVLIIWDRMFGTFVEEKPGEKIVYGLVEDVNSMNPFWLQLFYFPKSFSRMLDLPSWSDKLCVLINGPGWSPGKPRLGDPLDCPEVPDRQKFDPKIPTWQTIYVILHFLVALAVQDFLVKNVLAFSQLSVVLIVGYVIATLTSIGFVLENRPLGIYAELMRCSLTSLVLYVTNLGYPTPLTSAALTLFAASTVMWLAQYFLVERIQLRKTKTN
ncbi:unnamed protein product [Allacma fusca]|uniref:Alkylglycerol monooxygenase n=1 Tax=Allacma fusca TaxID=39272 RepID=A0A8J2JKX3_9HEXA|nr:unnamed protein product [Allacma fusca]